MNADAAVVARQVMDYLARRPFAADTLAGIAAWWIPDGLMLRRQAIQEALDHLVATGFLTARRLPSGESLYSASRNDGMDRQA